MIAWLELTLTCLVLLVVCHALLVIRRETRKREAALRDIESARRNLSCIEEMKREDAEFLRSLRSTR